MFDAKSVRKEAEAEVRKEREVEAKKKIKKVLIDIDKAKKVVRGLERELELLMVEIGEGV